MGKKEKEQGKITGRFQATGRGYGFLTPEGAQAREEDYFVPPNLTGGAWDGDSVSARLEESEGQDGQRPTAAVVRVLLRANRVVTGVLLRRGRELWLRPDSDKLPGEIRVLKGGRSAGAGEKAAVEMRSYGTASLPPTGTLRACFGRAGSREASVGAVLYRNEIDPAFPPAVAEAAAELPGQTDPAALEGRLDLREREVITIDGASAKDLDDAVSLWRDGEGRTVLGVHIADVSHYVLQGSALDLEAWERGTSVYFADRVIPMLPVELSNGICSLNPGVDRLTVSCLMTMDSSGQVTDYHIQKSVIRSAERMTYSDCNALLAGAGGALEARYARILPMLREMAALAKKLQKRLRSRGSLELSTRECQILCDGQGTPVEIRTREPGESEKLIESFMLAANETVAQHLARWGKPMVCRIHEKPSPDKAQALRLQLERFGYSLLQPDNFSLQKILDDARDKPEGPIIHTLVLRSLMKARYDVEDRGHFGLGAEHYCHFTSPIRRYPDLMVHRILTQVLSDGEAGLGRTMPWEKRMAAAAARAAVQSSRRELAAQSAEREIEKLYMAEYMAAHVGESMAGTVSGVVKTGAFVMLPNGVEGFLSVRCLPSDRWHCDEERMALRGEHTGRTVAFGMQLQVVCLRADAGSGEIDFALEGEDMPAAQGGQPSRLRAADHPHRARERTARRPKPPRHKPHRRGRGR